MGEACLTHVELVIVISLAHVFLKHWLGTLYFEKIYKDLPIACKDDAL